MKLALMQPYLFPYLGYVQLMGAVDTFVVYDDVSYINRGWINRNTMLSTQGPQRFTLELIGASQNKNINDIQVGNNRTKILRSVDMNYRRAPFFSETMPYVETCLEFQTKHLAELLQFSLVELARLLGMKTRILVSSQLENSFPDLSGQDRVTAICRALSADHYINPEGGMTLYSGGAFADKGIELGFLRHKAVPYGQFPKTKEFVPHLSVIDALMFVGVEGVKNKLSEYELLQNGA